jgi:putative ATPase
LENLFTQKSNLPLAEKLRPTSLGDFIGQEHIVGKDKILRRIIESDRIVPMIFWGPPGCGKTTLAKIIAGRTKSQFVFISAVASGVADLKKIVAEAGDKSQFNQIKTILFIDEIHRFNKSQQDFLLPYVENGTVTLIGATTENPSFQVNAPLLSRARVFHFREQTIPSVAKALKRAISRINLEQADYVSGRSEGPKNKIEISKKALELIANLCEGDLRDAYNALELAIISAEPRDGIIKIDELLAQESIQQKFIRYDKGADGHYDAISALHKAIRASQPDAALHYLARMLEAGEDPLYVIRRLIRCASEDIGMADSQALILATSVLDATRHLGMPEANNAIAQLVIYLSIAPKSRAVDEAYASAKNDVTNSRLEPVPLKIRNASSKIMKDFGFGKDYKMYDKESLLPDNLKGKKYWRG